MKISIFLVAIFFNIVCTQDLCPVVQTWPGSTCTDACVENMKNEVEMSAGFSNYKDYVKKKFDEFIWSECHNCIYIYCGLVHQSYGISMTNEICRY